MYSKHVFLVDTGEQSVHDKGYADRDICQVNISDTVKCMLIAMYVGSINPLVGEVSIWSNNREADKSAMIWSDLF